MRNTRSTSLVLATVLFLLCASWLPASPVGSISGTVKDASGAFVPGVKVTLTNTATNARLETNTDANGEFQFPQLAPSTYSIAVEAKGFKRALSTAWCRWIRSPTRSSTWKWATFPNLYK